MGAWFSLGAELDAMYEHHDDAMKMKQAVQDLISSTSTFSFGPPYYKYIPTKFLKKTHQSLDTISEMTTKYADEHLERIMEGVKKGEKQYGQSLLEQWLIEGKQSKEKAVQNAISMMGAGMDTVSVERGGLCLMVFPKQYHSFVAIYNAISEGLHCIKNYM